MLDFITKGIAKVFGTKSDRDLKEITPLIGKINGEWEQLKAISNDELRNKTTELKAIINERLKEIDSKIESLTAKAQTDGIDIHEKDELYQQVDLLELERNKELEKVLLDILPQAFAVVKETANRFANNKKIEVTATESDIEFAQKYPNIELVGHKALWHNEWQAAGNTVVWNMVHYDVQLIGGIVLHTGKISEMGTGEGKTLVATLPAYLNALAGRGVHIVTVNDYLAKRDAEWMSPIFQFHGLTIDCIDKYRPHSPERKNAYLCDITYGTNNEFGFDYLRDNMSNRPEELVQRRHHYAMVDEVDSVLIDDARTPLIISGPVANGDVHEFFVLKPKISELVERQRKLAADFLVEAKKLIADGNTKDGGLSLFRAHRALPKYKPLIKFLGEQGMRVLMEKTEAIYLADNQKLMPEADEPLYFTIDEKHNQVDLTDRGVETITQSLDEPNFFILPDLAIEIDALEKDTMHSDQERADRKQALMEEFSLKSQRIHEATQLLKAYTLFEKDTEYIVTNGKVLIVDEQTGRVMDGRRYSDGLHQAIEAKEGVKIEDATQTYATVSLQNYFRMYHKLAGMTGTAETEAGEFWEIYKLDVVTIPTNKKIQRDDREDKVYRTVREKFNAAIDEINEMVAQGRPVLVGTTSVEVSELFSRALKMRNIKHNVLNAKQHAREAEIVAEAGQSGAVTIATNMAGRGTDIKLSPEALAAGGLAIIGTERHESRRVDRQLRGRAGRQGDVGSSQFFVSMEDNLMRLFVSENVARAMDKYGGMQEGDVIQSGIVTKSIERAQKKVEENHFGSRKRLLEYDDVMNTQREQVYKKRRNALFGDRLEFDVQNSIYDLSEGLVDIYKRQNNFEGFNLDVINYFGFHTSITKEDLLKQKLEVLAEKLFEEADAHRIQKFNLMFAKLKPLLSRIYVENGANKEGFINVPFTDGKRMMQFGTNIFQSIETEGKSMFKDLQKGVVLSVIDNHWKDHLRDMDDLRQSVRNASYEQKDPLVIYKLEGFKSFQEYVDKVNKEIVSFLMKSFLAVEQEQAPQIKVQKEIILDKPKVVENRQDDASEFFDTNAESREVSKNQPIKSEKVYGRNDIVNVQYQDGTILKEVKYKKVENDLAINKCVVIE
jgi:preprotein translocase subunit SecA